MAFFQHTVTDKYLKSIDKLTIQEKFIQFKEHFHNPQIQQNIRNSKEEQYQEGFLRDLFVNILGYTLNPQNNFNLTTEYKNIKDSKKADGAIIIADKVQAVIELKGTDTTDLGKIETQAFGYKNNQPDCIYIITSNFEKLRFYIDNAIEHLEFNLFTLTEKEFELLYLCLAHENIEKGIPKKIKVESISQEDIITKKLYNDYSLFKRELHQNLVQLNPEFNELELFKKSQKLLDRFLFLFFAEDRQLLPPNSVRLILNDWRELQERDVQIPLYDRYKKYFEYLNTGFKGKRYDVFAYNGGLFKPDEILDAVKIEDELLFKHTFKLSEYDFASEVDVNILGHIFENSLNELDEIKAQLEGQEIDKTKTKRKKDGVFYTPKYITKYIVENTIGKLCSEKKEELQINEEDYTTDNRIQKKTKQAHFDKLKTYREWLLQLTICDPACGSGAFLNQALDFLIAEHQYIDELQAKLFGDSLVLSDVEKSILENNIFGVDLNEESVEIAKLSLWLRTAQPNRKLNDLNNNIKCGNSLIDDPAIAGEKAFNWQQEFPTVFKEKNKKAWHITTATHNSRYSQRMFDNYVVLGEAVWFDKDDEIVITQTIRDIAIEDNLNIVEYNICGDHMHILLVCDAEELPYIVKKIKGRSARSRNSNKGINPLVRTEGEKSVSIWTQKFGQTEIKSDEYLTNAIEYIRTNRKKHELPEIKEIEILKKEFLCTIDHAFRPEYKGGFDVVIGNPPYVQQQLNNNEKLFYAEKYLTVEGKPDLYRIFIQKSIELLSNEGAISFITPNSFLSIPSAKKLRIFIRKNIYLNSIVEFKGAVFENVNMNTVIFVAFKNIQPSSLFIIKDSSLVPSFDTLIDSIHNSSFNYNYNLYIKGDNIQTNIQNDLEKDILEKIICNTKKLSEIAVYTLGLQVYHNSIHNEEQINSRVFHSTSKFDSTYIPEIGGLNVRRYCVDQSFKEFVSYGEWCYNKPDKIFLEGARIFIREIPSKKNLICSLYEGEGVPNKAIIIIKTDIYFIYQLLAVLNSSLIGFYINKTTEKGNQNLFPRISLTSVKNLPVKSDSNVILTDKSKLICQLNKELQESAQKFQRAIQRKFELEDLSTKLQNWYTLTFKEFVAELGKKKVKLSLAQESEWEDYFLQEQTKAIAIKNQIDATDKEIDRMVYELYELTEEEIKIVEGTV